MFNIHRPAPLPESIPQLLVVMPVFNEQAAIAKVAGEWFDTLSRQLDDFILLIIDDGSTDDTSRIIESLANEHGERIQVISRENRGHGQSCIEGYRYAIARKIPFILQIDSDGQSDPSHFHEFWNARTSEGVVYGKRSRSDGYRRILVSKVLRLSLRWIAGVDCLDANVPYRLMATEACTAAILRIPPTINLANIALAVELRRDPSVRHRSIPIGFPPRIGGEPSVTFGKFAIKAIELFRQLSLIKP